MSAPATVAAVTAAAATVSLTHWTSVSALWSLTLASFPVFLSGQLHLSFSLSTGGEDGLKEQREKELIPIQSLNLLLKSIGATLTDVQDVVFKYTISLVSLCS